MKNTLQSIIIICLVIILGVPVLALAKTADIKGSKDHPLVTRMNNFFIDRYETNEFDSETFKTDDGKIEVEGRKYIIHYEIQPNTTPPGKIEILRNYLNALEGIGAQTLLKSSYYYVFKIEKDGMETWVKVDPGNSDGKKYTLTIVEKAMMKQVVVADAAAMKKEIIQSGHMAVYGIYFDSGKTDVKKNSDEALNQIAILLKNNSTLNLFVVGHTDSDGTLEYNMKLSEQRAQAVVKLLTSRYGIGQNRLIPKGLGPLSPVDSNRSPDGRAKNRRVELVEKIN